MLTCGGRSVADMADLRNQPELFGDVAAVAKAVVHEIDLTMSSERHRPAPLPAGDGRRATR